MGTKQERTGDKEELWEYIDKKIKEQ